MLSQYLHDRLGLKRQRPRKNVKSEYAHRVDITARIDAASARLLWTHEFGGTDDLAHPCRTGLFDNTRDPEIGHEGAVGPFFEENVVGLHIAVDNALGVCVGQRPRDFLQDACDFGSRQRAASPYLLPQRLPLDVRHHEIDELFDFVDREYGDDVRV